MLNKFKFYLTLGLIMSSLFFLSPNVYASEIENYNKSELDLWFENQLQEEQPSNQATFEENDNIAVGQKQVADYQELQQIKEEGRKLNAQIKAKQDSKAELNTLSTVTSAATGTSASFYTFDYYNTSKGGSGAGTSSASWYAAYKLYVQSQAYIAGSYWATGRGWNYFTPTSSGTYNITSNYYLRGNIVFGNLSVILDVIDTNTGNVSSYYLLQDSSGYYNYSYLSNTKQHYFKAGTTYSLRFRVETKAQGIASAGYTDFGTTELDGDKRQVNFWSMKVVKY